MIRMNPIFKTDSYKVAHHRLFPDGMTYGKTYTESRGGPTNGFPFVALQIWLDELAEETITMADVEEARPFFQKHFLGADIMPYEGFKIIVNEYGGKYPVRIKAVDEGSYVPTNNVLFTVESTDERLFWLPGWLETASLRAGWYGSTFAGNDFDISTVIYKYLTMTSDAPDTLLPSRNHDFGARGASSSEEASIGGAVHTLISEGSDTLEGIVTANRVYGLDMAAFSIPATEHSVTTAHGRNGEALVVSKMLQRFPGAPLGAVVADSYDVKHFVDVIIGEELKQAIIDSGKLLVVRPDSGDAIANVVYILQSLDRNFGSIVNGKGYKVLDGVAVINGDGNSRDSIAAICQAVKNAGFSLDNVAFGTGGGLYREGITRDRYKFATKLCLAIVNGENVPVFKSPVDQPDKKSKAGDLDLVKVNGRYLTIDRLQNTMPNTPSELKVRYENGTLFNRAIGSEVRERINQARKAVVEHELAQGQVRF